jgi:hypothetical protein
MAWVAIEVTGGWGGPAMRRLKIDFRYPFVYMRQKLSAQGPEVRGPAGLAHRVRGEEVDARRADGDAAERRGRDDEQGLADEYGILWYVLDDRNRAKPEFGKTSDRLIARGISVCVAREKPLRPDASIEGYAIYQDTGSAATSRLILWADSASSGLPLTPSGGDVTLVWNASGIFKL